MQTHWVTLLGTGIIPTKSATTTNWYSPPVLIDSTRFVKSGTHHAQPCNFPLPPRELAQANAIQSIL
ncbi:hypothetical protein B0I35DRAFT_252398 [Stachybotrys elegans]|uniref:Uncharacterized protein n=1 Tax=Stachybotrys elegans TaxID=80388 RepID=A0A8K0SS04_9HYPO|nr:hypothetical protein B0I35DRAFT_252398 [Stachybotrys elegans]